MVDQGYDVWLYNARGIKYSDKNDQDSKWTLRERWDFTFADMGTDIGAAFGDVLTGDTDLASLPMPKKIDIWKEWVVTVRCDLT